MFVDYNELGDLAVFVSDDDKCNRCKHDTKCPLIASIHQGAVNINGDSLDVLTCDLFEAVKELKWGDINE